MSGRIEKVLFSTRVGSSLDPALFYEFLHARMEGGTEAVILQMTKSGQPGASYPPRIPLKDLKEVEEALLIFMEAVRKKTGDDTRLERAFFSMPGAPREEEEHAVFRSDPNPSTTKHKIPVAEVDGMAISAGPRKGYYDPKAAAAAAAAAPGAAKATPAETVPPKVIPFGLRQPPTVDDVLKELQADAHRLIVFARAEIAPKVQAYVDGVMAGNLELTQRPGDFEAVVVQRKGGRGNLKHKMGAALAQAIIEIVANPTKVLWVAPDEGAK